MFRRDEVAHTVAQYLRFAENDRNKHSDLRGSVRQASGCSALCCSTWLRSAQVALQLKQLPRMVC